VGATCAAYGRKEKREQLRCTMKPGRYSLSMFLAVSMFCSLVAAQQNATASSSATVPRLVNFSGKTADAQGKPISGIAGVTLAIYKDQYEGASLWLETQNVQADTKGNYTVQLGATKPDGLPLDLFSSGDARWLGVTVNGGPEQPRVLLLSVPYALKAADAETIGGLPPSAFVLANKSQGTGTSTKPAATASTGAAKNAAATANPPVTGKGTLNFIPMWDSTSDIVSSMMFQKSSAIGIGTTAPAATLDVNGKSDVRDTLTLFPKGTDSTLAVNGTTFKVDQTGKVTFISGQTFPGAGTVSSVGLSAPSSDFNVTGSPVTKSGTLALKWTVAPTNADTANAIVKRDGLGSFSAGAITASLGVTGLSAGSAAVIGNNSSSGYGVFGSSTAGTAVWGQSFGTSGTSNGIEGVTSSAIASGVAGVNNGSGGFGVYGSSGNGVGVHGDTNSPTAYGVEGINTATGGIGVLGSAPNGDGFYTVNNVYQDRSAGGWVKAMAFFTQNGVATCFNSTLIGAPATVKPCGFTFTKAGVGDYIIDFGFQVDDRFFSISGTNWQFTTSVPFLAVCTDFIGVTCNNALTPNQVEVTSKYLDGPSGTNFFIDRKLYLVVY
jgi:hypothetical protein